MLLSFIAKYKMDDILSVSGAFVFTAAMLTISMLTMLKHVNVVF